MIVDFNIEYILLLWSISMLYLLYRTNSIKVSISTTIIVISMGVIGICQILNCLIIGVLITMIIISGLVWRVLPHNSTDSWDFKRE